MIQWPLCRIRVRSQQIGINWVQNYRLISKHASGFLSFICEEKYLEFGVLKVLNVMGILAYCQLM